jgi:ABC-type sugar transport system, periplasmic component
MKKSIAIILSFILIIAIILPASAFSSIAVKGIKLNTSKITLKVGQTYKLKVTLTPANTTQKSLSFVTANKKIATIDTTGIIKGVSKGTTTITVYTSNKKIFAACNVTITQLGGSTNSLGSSVSILAFDNGKTVGAWELAKKKFMAANPGVTDVKFETTTKIQDILRPRLLSGNAPDVVYDPSNPYADYINAGAMEPLDDLMDTLKIASRDNQSIKNAALKGAFRYFQKNNHTYALPFTFGINGLYYNTQVLKDLNIKEPQTISEFFTACDKIKASGMYPITYTGVYCYLEYIFWPTIADYATQDELYDILELKPGAWLKPDIIKALKLFQTMAEKGYFEKGFMSMNHTQAQMEFLNKKAAFIPNGPWLETEMKDNWPQGFTVKYMPFPANEQAGQTKYVKYNVTGIWVPSQAKHKAAGKEFIKYMYDSDVIKEFAKGAIIMALNDPTKGIEDVLQPSVALTYSTIGKNGVSIDYMFDLYQIYSNRQFLRDTINLITSGQDTAEQAAQVFEDGMQKLAKDPNVVKWKRP